MVVNDLEMMMQTLITTVFSTVFSVEEGVRLLEIFEPLSAREVTEMCDVLILNILLIVYLLHMGCLHFCCWPHKSAIKQIKSQE